MEDDDELLFSGMDIDKGDAGFCGCGFDIIIIASKNNCYT
jgi:hypothetical protein